ncbi:hypothetical protein CP354_10515 [Lactobacillus sp. UMNPBX3]|nr:hypothetical protein CP354_10515 [Lactobacillus sp. UMNPBX3]
MIPDVTPNGVFYLPPTGWLTSFYNPPFYFSWLPYGIIKANTRYRRQDDDTANTNSRKTLFKLAT